MAQLSPGDVFAGYRLDGLVGRGGMGVIYRATESRPSRTVALKVVAPELAADDVFRARFLRESEVAASIEHPHVVPVLRVGEENGLLFIAMRFIVGRDLRAIIAAQRRLEPLRAAQIVDQIADALDTAHEQGLVHRDVKPANVLVETRRRGDHVYLTDFGLTKTLTGTGQLTGTGKIVGTIDYIAPEQLQGEPVDARADVYSLGCLLFEALAGRTPYKRDRPEAVMFAHLDAAPPKPSEVVPGLPDAFDRIIGRALAKDPDERYPSAGDLGFAALAAAERRPVDRVERSVASGEAAPMPSQSGRESVRPELRTGVTPGAQSDGVVVESATGTPSQQITDEPALPPSASDGPGKATSGFHLLRGGVVLAGVAALTVAAVIATQNTGGGSTNGKSAGSRHAEVSGRRVVTSAIPVGRDPFGVAVENGSVWVANHGDGTVTRLNASSGTPLGQPIPVGSGKVGEDATAIAADQGSVWVANAGEGTLTRIDADSGKVVGKAISAVAPGAVAVGEGSVWVTSPGVGTVTRLEATSGKTLGSPIRVGSAPSQLATGHGDVWVVDSTDHTVTRIDGRSGKVLGRPIKIAGSPWTLAVADNSVWVVSEFDYTITRLDATTGSVIGPPISVGREPVAVAIGRGSVWVANSLDNTVTRINANSGRIEGRPIRVGAAPDGIAVGQGSVWVANSGDGTVTRLDARSGTVLSGNLR